MAGSSELEWLEHFKLTREVDSPQQCRSPLQIWQREPERLGAGAYGIVYLEKDARSGEVRAVKEITKRPNHDYKAELIALTRLSRPAYADYFGQFLGWYDDFSSVSLVMEYFEHGDLRQHLQAQLPEHETRDITLQLLSGLQIMHNDGFTHRDLKPENIFVVQTSPLWRVKIGDFGVTKRIQNDSTVLATQVGTVNYMAPEVADVLPEPSESMSYTNVVDTWSVGVILYEMLCAEKPFQSIRSLREYCCGEIDFPDESLRLNHVSEQGTAIVRRLLTSSPLLRPDANTALQADWFGGRDEDMISQFKGMDISKRHNGTQMQPNSFIAHTTLSHQQHGVVQSTSSHPSGSSVDTVVDDGKGSTARAGAGSRAPTTPSTIAVSTRSSTVVNGKSISHASGREERYSQSEVRTDNEIPPPLPPRLETRMVPPDNSNTQKRDTASWNRYPFEIPESTNTVELPRYGATASKAGGERIYFAGQPSDKETVAETWVLHLRDGKISCENFKANSDLESPRNSSVWASAGNEKEFVVAFPLASKQKDISVLDLQTKHWRKCKSDAGRWQITGFVDGILYECDSNWFKFGVTKLNINSNANAKNKDKGGEHVSLRRSSVFREPLRPLPRTRHTMVTYKQSLIVFGGERRGYQDAHSETKLNDIWKFDIESRSWTELQPERGSPAASCDHKSCLVGDAMYVFGGDITDLVKYDLSANVWFRLISAGEAPTARVLHCMVAVENCIVIFFGSHPGGQSQPQREVDDFKHAWVLDLGQDLKWVRL